MATVRPRVVAVQAMLDGNSAFGRKAVTDKYGRKIKHEIKEDLSKFYDIEDGEEDVAPSGKISKEKKAQKADEAERLVQPGV